MINISVLMSVYIKEKSLCLEESLNSIVNQTAFPNEVVIVKDGPLTEELELVLNSFIERFPALFIIINLEKNYGLGYALSVGLKYCSNEIIARMDSDDISASDRFKEQYQLMIDGEFDIVGTNIEEFNKYPGDLSIFRRLPEKGSDIINFSKFRNPFNHPSVMFRKTIAINSGNYNANYLLFEDWHLFVRMIQNGAKTYNLQKNLLYFRVSDKIHVIKRRSGIKYLISEFKFSLFLLTSKHINFFEWFIYIIVKLPLRILPPSLIKVIYYKIARQ